jgi:predicted HAD superfamily Cof-like phosphohydrolase
MKSETQRAAEKLMRAAGQTIRDTPGEPSEADRILRAKLIMEEALETVVALGVTVRLNTPMMGGTLSVNVHNAEAVFEIDGNFDLIESVDGCCDLNVVVAGTLSALGVPDMPVQQEVERSNRSKLLPDGTLPPHPTVPGKFGKGPGYTPPDLTVVLASLCQEPQWRADSGDASGEKSDWQSPETAPRDGTQFLGDFGWPWPCPAVWNAINGDWVIAVLQAGDVDGKPDYYFETDSERPHNLKRWLPMPELPKGDVAAKSENL